MLRQLNKYWFFLFMVLAMPVWATNVTIDGMQIHGGIGAAISVDNDGAKISTSDGSGTIKMKNGVIHGDGISGALCEYPPELAKADGVPACVIKEFPNKNDPR